MGLLFAVALIVCALLVAALAGVYRRVKELELYVYHGVGQPLPLPGELVDTLTHAPSGLRVNGATAILKINAQCPVCEDAVAGLADHASRFPDVRHVIVGPEAARHEMEWPSNVELVTDPRVYNGLRSPWVPALFVVDADGLILLRQAVVSGEAVIEYLRVTSEQGVGRVS